LYFVLCISVYFVSHQFDALVEYYSKYCFWQATYVLFVLITMN
jgi:hypothetical protein